MPATRRPRKLPYDGVRNGWYATLPDPAPARVLSSDVSADWAVLGGGACGLSFARRIAELRPDDTVIVVEGMRVGYGTSGRNAGFMLRHHSHGGIKDPDAAKRSDRFFQTGQSYLRDIVEQHQIRCDWSDWGQIYVSASAPGEAHLDDVADGFNTLGIANEGLDQDAVEAITGTRFYTRGVRVESGGALVQPAAMMRGLGETLPTNVTLYEDSPVTEIRSDGGFTLVGADGTVRSPKLIVAANLFAEEMGLKRHRVVPIASFGTLTRPLDDEEMKHVGNAGEFGLLPASPNGSTVRLTRDRRVLMRNTLWYARSKRFEDDLIARMEDRHRQSIAERWPALENVDFAGTWGGIMAFTRNEGTVWGEVSDGLYVLVTTDTAPMTRGTALGKLLAEDLAGVDSEELRALKAAPKAAFVPPDPILKFYAERRINAIERDEAGER